MYRFKCIFIPMAFCWMSCLQATAQEIELYPLFRITTISDSLRFTGAWQQPQRATKVEDFVCPGWMITDLCREDFNRDGFPDFILAIQSPDTVTDDFSLFHSLRPLCPYYPKRLIAGLYDPITHEYVIGETSEVFLNPPNMLFTGHKFISLTCEKNGQIHFLFEYIYSGGWYWRNEKVYTFEYRNGHFEMIEENYDYPEIRKLEYFKRQTPVTFSNISWGGRNSFPDIYPADN